MGQKINPIGFRIHNGNKKTWASTWFADSKEEYKNNVVEDVKIQRHLAKNRSDFSIGKSIIERKASNQNIGQKDKGNTKVIIFSGKVSAVIGNKGQNIEKLESALKNICSGTVSIDVREIKKVNLDANLVARSIADKVAKRQSFKKVTKFAIESVMKSGAVGVKIMCSGRLNGAEIARSETFKEGAIPLHTLRADIDYACEEALTIYGIIGIKVWICIKR